MLCTHIVYLNSLYDRRDEMLLLNWVSLIIISKFFICTYKEREMMVKYKNKKECSLRENLYIY